MNLGQIVAEVLSHQFASNQYSDYLTGRGDYGEGIINQAQQYITAQVDFRDLLTYADTQFNPGTGAYAVPSDYFRLERVVRLSYPPARPETLLTPITAAEYDTLPEQSGSPTSYVIQGNSGYGTYVYLYPAPDSSSEMMRLFYWKNPDELVYDGDHPQIPWEYHHLLVTYALVKCFERENDYEAALYHQQRLDVGIQKCRGEVQYDRADKNFPKTIEGPWNGPESVLTVWKQ